MKKPILLLIIFYGALQISNAQPGNLDLSFGNKGIVKADLGTPFNYPISSRQALSQPDGSIYLVLEADGATVVTKILADGSTDLTFGNNGWSVTLPLHGAQAALQADGKIVLCGEIRNYKYNDYVDGAVARVNPDGSLDEAFGINGITVTDIQQTSDHFFSVAIQKDGKILIAGYSEDKYSGPDRSYLVRYNTNGVLDRSFGSFGKLTIVSCPNAEGICEYLTALAIQDDGKFVVAGRRKDRGAGTVDFIVLRYNTKGIRDTSFSSDGKLVTDFENGADIANSIAIQSDGKIVVAGTALARYNTDGSLDSSFDADGKKLPEFTTASIIIQRDGKIVTTGYANGAGGNDFVLTRYNPDGILDSTFDKDGKIFTDFTSSDDQAVSLVVQSDGKLITLGTSSIAAVARFAVARYNTDGSPDSSFDGDGKLSGVVSQGKSSYQSTVVQADGKVITAGYTWNGSDNDFVLARYNTDGSPDNTFSGDGIQITDFGANDYAKSLVILSDGKILAGGTAGANFALARYNTDGSPDMTFGSNGLQITDIGPADYIDKIAVQQDGKIVVCGSALARFNADGSLDNSFNVTSIGCNDLAIQADGKIVTIGGGHEISIVRYNTDGSPDPTFKFTTDDFSSDNNNYPFVNVFLMRTISIAIQNDGKMVIGGFFAGGGARDPTVSFQVLRLGANGEKDNTFNDGLINIEIGDIDIIDIATSLKIQSDNTIILAGYSYSRSGNAFTILRFDPNLVPDGTFGTDGIQITQVSKADDLINDIAIYDNKLYAVGYGQFPGNLGVVARYSLDESNIAPAVSITAPPSDTLYTSPATIHLQAAATDADGMITRVRFYNGGTLLYTDSVSPYSYTLENATTGNYSFIAKAADNRGLTSSSAAIAVTVINAPNKAPLVNITDPIHNTVYTSADSITLSAEASDTDGVVKVVRFYNGSTLLYADSVYPYTFSIPVTPGAGYLFIAKATDDNGLTSSSAGVAITPAATANKAPFVSIYNPSNNKVYAPADSITINADAYDEDGAIKNVKFYQGANLLKTDNTSPYSCTLANPVAGQYVIIAKATDNNGLSNSSASVCFNVAAPVNKAPMVNITSPLYNAIYYAPAAIPITAAASDADGTIKNVKLYYGATLLSTESTSPYTHTLTNVAPGSYTFIAKATDDKGKANSSASISVLVKANMPPSVSVIKPADNEEFVPFATIRLEADARDVDGAVKVDFYAGDSLLATELSHPFTYPWQKVPPGIYVITAKATDDHGRVTVSAPITVKIINPGVPVPVFGFTINGVNLYNVNNGETDTSEVDAVNVCSGESYTTSTYFHSSPLNLYQVTSLASGGTVRFNGAKPINKVITAAQLTATAGKVKVGLADPKLGGSVTQTITPFTDLNSNGKLDSAKDIIGETITIKYTVEPALCTGKPFFSFYFNRTQVFNSNNGIADPSEAAGVTMCNGKTIISAATFYGTPSTLYDVKITSAGGTLFFNGIKPASKVITASDFIAKTTVTLADAAVGGTVTQTITPFIDVNNNGALDTGDSAGDPIALNYISKPCANVCPETDQPAFSYYLNGLFIGNINNGISDPEESESITFCNTEQFLESSFSGSYDTYLYNILYDIKIESSGGAITIDGSKPRSRVISNSGFSALMKKHTVRLVDAGFAGSFTQTITPFKDLNKNGILDSSDCTGDAVVLHFAVNSCPGVPCPETDQPTFGYNLNGTPVANINNGILDTSESASVTICDGEQYTVSGRFHSSIFNNYNIAYVKSGGPLLFNGFKITDAVLTASEYDSHQGAVTINLTKPNQGGTVKQTVTPFTDSNKNGILDWEDCAGDPIVTTFKVNPCAGVPCPAISKPTISYKFNGKPLANINNGILDSSEFASVTLCDGGQYVESARSHSSIYNKYNLSYVKSGGTILFNGVEVADAVITPSQYPGGKVKVVLADPNIGGTVVKTVTPFTDLYTNGILDAADCVGEPIVTTVTVNSCTNKITSLMSRKGSGNKSGALKVEVSMAVSPNPAKGIATIYTTGLQRDKQTTLSVISATGVIMKTIKIAGSNQTIPLDVSLFASGVYTVEIINGDKVLYKKLVKL